MKRNKTFIAVLLTIIAFAFIVFVVFMQQRFNNPEFTDLTTAEVENENLSETQNDENEKEEIDEDTDQVAGAAGSIVNEDAEAEEDDEDVEPTYSTRTVLVDTLNARSGPGVDHDITGVLVLDQEVEVEDHGNEWVKVITDDFTGYVNERFLSEEQ